MTSSMIEVKGLSEIVERMKQYPQKVNESLRVTLQAALLVLWESVPPYPQADETSTYRRTGTLGRSLGSGMEGGKSGGQPDIYQVYSLGSAWEAKFGSNLDYAPYVIGDGDDQAWMHYRWWRVSVIKERAEAKVQKLFDVLGDKMAKFLEGKGV
jgi:hypothetical protein